MHSIKQIIICCIRCLRAQHCIQVYRTTITLSAQPYLKFSRLDVTGSVLSDDSLLPADMKSEQEWKERFDI